MYLLIVWSIFLPNSLLNQPTCKKNINKCHLRNFRVYPIITRPDLKPEYPKPENPNYNIGRVSGIIFLRKYLFYPKPRNFTRSTPLLCSLGVFELYVFVRYFWTLCVHLVFELNVFIRYFWTLCVHLVFLNSMCSLSIFELDVFTWCCWTECVN